MHWYNRSIPAWVIISILFAITVFLVGIGVGSYFLTPKTVTPVASTEVVTPTEIPLELPKVQANLPIKSVLVANGFVYNSSHTCDVGPCSLYAYSESLIVIVYPDGVNSFGVDLTTRTTQDTVMLGTILRAVWGPTIERDVGNCMVSLANVKENMITCTSGGHSIVLQVGPLENGDVLLAVIIYPPDNSGI